MTPASNEGEELRVEGPSRCRLEGRGNDLGLQFLQIMPGRSNISGKQEPAVPEWRALLSAVSMLKPSGILIRDKFY